MINIAIVGLGAIGQVYLQIIKDSDFASLQAVVDVREDAARAAAEVGNCHAFTNHQTMYETICTDAVIVCTPPKYHTDITAFFLENKVPVLCEKPLAVNTEEAQMLITKAHNTYTQLTMASKFRYVDDVIKAKSIIESGVLGEIKLLENAFVSHVDMADRWNSQKDISGGGVCIDNGTHSADIVRYLLGPIKSVHLVQSTYSPKLDVEDNALLLMRTQRGADARADLSWTFDKELPYFISVYGTNGIMHVGWKQSKYKQNNSSNWVCFGEGYQKVTAFKNKLKNFCSSLKKIEAPLINSEDAIASVLVIQAAYESVKKDCWINVSPPA